MTKAASHREGVWKQSNKLHKTGQHRSKGAVKNAIQGKVGKQGGKGGNKKHVSKSARKAAAQMLRSKKETEAIKAYRPTHMIMFPLNQESAHLHQMMGECGTVSKMVGTGYKVELDKAEYAVTRPNDVTSLLAQTTVCDVLLLYGRYDMDISDHVVSLLKMIGASSGFPTILFGVLGLDALPAAKRMQARRQLQTRFEATNILPIDKFKTYPMDTESDLIALLRQIKNIKKTPRIHKNRSFMLAEKLSFTEDGKLMIGGYLSNGISVNLPVHLPGVGDYLIDHVLDASGEVVAKSNATKQPDLNTEAEVDMMDAEQTFPTDEEMSLTDEVVRRVVPKGVSSYQAAWLDEDEDIEINEDDEEDEEEDDMPPLENEDDEDMMPPPPPPMDEDRVRFDSETTDDTAPDSVKYDTNYDYERESELLRMHRAAKDDREFPDEIDTPADCRVRLAKYRGLASFRTSPWDVNENLPQDYARIFKFRRWAHAKIRANKWKPELAETVAAGQFVTIVLKTTEDDKEKLKAVSELDSLLLFSLLPNEHRMSAIHFAMKRSANFDEEVKSKAELTFVCGFRRFKCRPIFSAHTNADKQKFERFLPLDQNRIVMTVYAPIMFPPAGVLAFKEGEEVTKLAAQGTLLSCTPDRVVLKRIILSGAPFRINKKTCTIRFMFHNQDDIAWFRPVELRTKYGRRGHITEHLGTHGHFKAKFDQHLSSMDTVIMNLYKRVYPKWNYEVVPTLSGNLEL